MDSEDSLSNYEILRKLGSGAFGNVYEASHKRASTTANKPQKVAIKIIPLATLNTNTRRKRISREVSLHESFPPHPSLLKLYSYFKDSKRFYIVTELCPYGNLHQYMRRHPNGLPEDQVRGLMLDITEGIQQLHSQGVIHRDLKLSNILLDHDMRAKIADFGLARIINDDSSAKEPFTFCGTPNYISPEILAQDSYGLSSDIWSLGCVFLTLLTGKPPFSDNGIDEVLGRVVTGNYKLPSMISRDAKSLALRMLCRDPVARISASEILKHRFLLGDIAELRPCDRRVIESESSPGTDSRASEQRYPTPHESQNRESEKRDSGRYENPDSEEPETDDRHSQLRALLHEIAWRNKGQPKSRSSRKLKSQAVELETCFRYKRPGSATSMDHRCFTLPKNLPSGHSNKGRLEEQSNSGTSYRKRTTFDQDEINHDSQHQRRRAEGKGRPVFGSDGSLVAPRGNPRSHLPRHTQSSFYQDLVDLDTFKPKGFPTMVEELISTVRRKKSEPASEKHCAGIETDAKGESKTKRMKELQNGLLSLLSDLGKNKTVGSNAVSERISASVSSSQSNQYRASAAVPLFCGTSTLHDDDPGRRQCSQRHVFSTRGIPPMTQKTKHGSLQVLPTGDLRVQLPSISPYIFNVSPPSDVVIVSDTGATIWQGNANDLPWRWTRIYRYASRFVEICRSRIPSVAIEVDGMRGRIMLNGVFEGILRRGSAVFRITYFRTHAKVLSVEHGKETLEWEGPADEMPPEWIDLWQCSIVLYRQCLSISESSSFNNETERTMKYIPDLGWYDCRDNYIQIFCEDGAKIHFNLREQKVVYSNPGRKDELWDADLDGLPSYICEKLDRLVRSN